MARKPTGTTSSSTAEYETFQSAILLVRGDTLPAIEMTLRDKNTAAQGETLDPEDSSTWAPYDLTGATVLFKFREEGSDAVKDTLTMVVNGDATTGKVILLWGNDTLDTAGKFTGEIEITNAEGKVSTVFDQLSFIVREDY